MKQNKQSLPLRGKTLVIVGLILLILVAGGAFYFKGQTTSVGTTSTDRNIFTSVKDALSKKMTLVCDFKDETGASVKSYIKNGAVRVSTMGESSDKSGEIIIKNKMMYMWDTKSKQGFVYNLPDQENNENGGGVTEDNAVNSESYFSMIDRYKDSCKVGTVEDSYFEVPKDINLQDMSKLLEDMKNNIPQYNLPKQ